MAASASDFSHLEKQLLNHDLEIDDVTETAAASPTSPIITRSALLASHLDATIQYGLLGVETPSQPTSGKPAPSDPLSTWGPDSGWGQDTAASGWGQDVGWKQDPSKDDPSATNENDEDSSSNASEGENERLYMNSSAPLSVLVCGVQGSGKSHSVSVMLENALIQPSRYAPIGKLHQPLCALVLYFDRGGLNSLACEAAHLAVAADPKVATPPVKVFASSTSLEHMRQTYEAISERILVEEFKFSQSELDAEAIQSIMAVGSGKSVPLYMHLVMDILKNFGDDKFTYSAFKAKLRQRQGTLNPDQERSLKQRMMLLDSMVNEKKETPMRFAPGQLTIVDLSDTFIDPAEAASLFEIIIRIFTRTDVGAGKLLVIDEAHKYLTKAQSSFSKSLESLIRQERHYGMQVVISTQEPTMIPPIIIELCSVMILHRFSSPSWWEHLKKRVPAELQGNDTFDKVVQLKTGRAILLGTQVLVMEGDGVGHLNRGYMEIQIRQRVTKDGGMAVIIKT